MALKMCIVLSTLVAATAAACFGQRSPYAGCLPVGIPTLQPTTTTTTSPPLLGNRLNDAEAPSTTTMRLPVDVMGDRQLVDYLKTLPIDHQPFWFLNWRAIEAYRQRPQTYEQRPNNFINRNWNF